MQIDSISLQAVIPCVFEHEKDSAAVAASDVWLVPGLTFRRGEVYTVDAASGMGKSSLCAFIFGTRTDYLGTISFDGRDVRSLHIADWCALRRSNIAYMPQNLDLFPQLSAIDNVLLKNRLTDFATEREIRAMLADLGLESRIDAPAAQLSVGQQQRVALVRAICQPFDFILLDEPVSHLDAANNRLCADMVQRAASRLGAAIIATSVGNPLALQGHVTKINL